MTLAAVCGIIRVLKEKEMNEQLKIRMKKFLVNYIPAVHEGQENKADKSYFYRVEMDEQFANRSEKDESAGMAAKDSESGLWKRFRWDRIQSAVAI